MWDYIWSNFTGGQIALGVMGALFLGAWLWDKYDRWSLRHPRLSPPISWLLEVGFGIGVICAMLFGAAEAGHYLDPTKVESWRSSWVHERELREAEGQKAPVIEPKKAAPKPKPKVIKVPEDEPLLKT